jgi:hypothetical protein
MNHHEPHPRGQPPDHPLSPRTRTRRAGAAVQGRTHPRADRAPLTIVSMNPSARRHRRMWRSLALLSVIAVAAVFVLLGVSVIPKLLMLNGTSAPPVQNSIVAVGSLGCDAGAATCHDRDIALLVNALDPALVLPLSGAAPPPVNGLDADESGRVWHRLEPRLRPVPGDQRVATSGVSLPSSSPGKFGYYSYDYAGWHLIALNGDCAEVGGCGFGSAQERWLADDLHRSKAMCTLAYWSKPRFSSARPGVDSEYDAFWHHLYSAGAELVLNADAGGYERFARQDPDGALDVGRGLRQFVVGTRSGSARSGGEPMPRSVVRNGDVPGVLQLILEPDSYRWQFVPIFGQRLRDAGDGACR